MSKQNIILLLMLLLFVVGGFILYQFACTRTANDPNNDSRLPQTVATTSPSQSADQYAGEISTDASGQNVYTNNKYGFQFTYPQGWRVGNNILGMPYGGSLQLFNYADTEPNASSRGFTKGENKIEAAIIDSSASSAILFSDSSDYPTKSRELISLRLAKETVAGINAELIGGRKYRTYLLQHPNMPGKSLGISISGDPSNFYVLDDLVRSIMWK